MKRWVTTLLLLLPLAGCNADETVFGQGGRDHVWYLVSVDGEPFNAQAYLTFPEPGQIAGQGPCNSFAGTQTAPYPWIDIGPLRATRRACPDLALESRFFALLRSMQEVEVTGDVMILRNDVPNQMVFEAKQP